MGPRHFLAKGRNRELERVRSLTCAGRVRVLTPAREVSRLFAQVGIPSTPVQLGVERSSQRPSTERWRVTTVCTSSDLAYQRIKGLDRFIRLVTDAGLAHQALILGHDAPAEDGIERRRVPHDQFLRLLAESRAYVQLSRSETYNLSAVEAKRLRVPVIVSDAEGHRDNVRHGFRVRSLADARQKLVSICSRPESAVVSRAVARNYRDSLARESLERFHESLCAVVGSPRCAGTA